MPLQQLLFSFQGRINRAKYWLASLIQLAIMAAAAAMIILGMGDGATAMAPLAAGLLVLAIVMVSGLAVGVKRLHDRNKSGWWLLFFIGAPALLEGAARAMPGMESGILGLLGAGINIWMIIELGFLRGTAGSNRFGPDPLASGGASPPPVQRSPSPGWSRSPTGPKIP